MSLALFAGAAVLVAIPAVSPHASPAMPPTGCSWDVATGISVPSSVGTRLALLCGHAALAAGRGYADPSEGFGKFLLYLVLPAIALAAAGGVTGPHDVDHDGRSAPATSPQPGRRACRAGSCCTSAFRGDQSDPHGRRAVVRCTHHGRGCHRDGVQHPRHRTAHRVIQRRDFDLIQGVVLVATLMYLVINLIVDLLYGVFDPRIRLRKAG